MSLLILNATLVNEGRRFIADVLVRGERIEKISAGLERTRADTVIDAEGLLLLPGMIDDQVHFREPGFPQKACIESESRAGVAGGVTSFMEMPNTTPPTTHREALVDKHRRAAATSSANYSFYLGAANDNLEDIKSVDRQLACGIKIFMGSSTGNMLVNHQETLRGIFRHASLPIATHCEDDPAIKANEKLWRERFGEDVPAQEHARIRSAEACYKSSSLAITLAREFDSRLHVLHLTTERELEQFEPGPVEGKKITAEVCVHHLFFDEADYAALGHRIKCNPAIKTRADRDALRRALAEGRIDIVATDHAPHTYEEKQQTYFKAPAGLPLIQHPLLVMLELAAQGHWDLETVVEKTSHNVARRFEIAERGFLREGYCADLVLIDPRAAQTVTRDGLHYRCGWSPFEGMRFSHSIHTTIVNGHRVYQGGKFFDAPRGQALKFQR